MCVKEISLDDNSDLYQCSLVPFAVYVYRCAYCITMWFFHCYKYTDEVKENSKVNATINH